MLQSTNYLNCCIIRLTIKSAYTKSIRKPQAKITKYTRSAYVEGLFRRKYSVTLCHIICFNDFFLSSSAICSYSEYDVKIHTTRE